MPIIQSSPVITSTGQIANNAVETADIKDAAVTGAKIAPGTDGDVLTTVAGVPAWQAPASIPAGTVVQFAGASAPTGYIFADGSSLLRAGTYATLFGVIGTVFGSADGTHFTLPDLRQRVPVGKHSSGTFATLGATGGEETHTLTTTEIPDHNHTIFGGDGAGSARPNPTRNGNSGGANFSTDSSSLGGGAHNNLQPYIVLNYIIKY